MRKVKILSVTCTKKGRKSITIPTIYEDLFGPYMEMSEKDGTIMLKACTSSSGG